MVTFGSFALDVRGEQLLRAGREIKVRRQVFHALRVLAMRTGQRVSRDELIAEAWGGTHVSPHTVDVTITDARKALGDCSNWISRVNGGRYRLMVPASDPLIERGLHLLTHNTGESLRDALSCFTEAAAHAAFDPRAFHGQCACHLALVSFGLTDGVTAWRRFHAAHTRAAALIESPILRADYGYGLLLCQRDVEGAERHLCQAIAAAPDQPLTCVRMMAVAVAKGDLDAALDWAMRGRRAGPLMSSTSVALAAAHVWRREFAAAAHVGGEAVRLHPHCFLARVFYGNALQCSGRVQEALAAYRVASTLSDALPWTRALEAACLVQLNEWRSAGVILDELIERQRSEYVDPFAMAYLRAAQGETRQAIAALDEAVDTSNGRWYTLACDPLFDNLRKHSAFRALCDEQSAPSAWMPMRCQMENNIQS